MSESDDWRMEKHNGWHPVKGRPLRSVPLEEFPKDKPLPPPPLEYRLKKMGKRGVGFGKKVLYKAKQEAKYRIAEAKHKRLLKEEQRIIMESKWKYRCYKCDKRFPTKAKRKEHMRRHTMGKRLLKGLRAAAYA